MLGLREMDLKKLGRKGEIVWFIVGV